LGASAEGVEEGKDVGLVAQELHTEDFRENMLGRDGQVEALDSTETIVSGPAGSIHHS